MSILLVSPVWLLEERKVLVEVSPPLTVPVAQSCPQRREQGLLGEEELEDYRAILPDLWYLEDKEQPKGFSVDYSYILQRNEF